MASNFTVLPLTVPTVACNLSVKCTSSDKRCSSDGGEERPSAFEKCLHSKCHHETITFTRVIWMNTTVKDKFYYALGLLSAIITGAVIPIININFGQMLDIYVQHDEYKHILYDSSIGNSSTQVLSAVDLSRDDFISLNQTIPQRLQKFRNNSYNLSFTILAIGFVYFFLCYMFAVLLELVSTRIVQRLRLKLYQTLFTYDDLLTDCVTTIDFASRMEDTICKFEKWIGTPIGLLFYMISSALFSFISAVYHGWELTLILISLLPLLIVIRMYISKKFSQLNDISNQITCKTGLFVASIIDYIRLILSYNVQAHQEMKFNNLLHRELIVNRKKIVLEAFVTACLWFVSYLTFAIGVWYAAKFIIISRDTTTTDDDLEYTVGHMIIIFWNVLSITYFVIRIKCYSHQFCSVPFHASTLVNFIERQSHDHEKGLRPASFIPSIKFINVTYGFQLNSGCEGCSNESSTYLFSTADEKSLTSSVLSPLTGTNSTSHVRFQLPTVSTNYSAGEKVTREKGKLCLSSLSESLYDVSFSIDQGESLCILGEEGSGTSVISKLLYQFFILDGNKKGDILLGDNSISTLNREWVRSVIGYIASDAIIYDSTIRENVWIADKSSTEDEVARACDEANIGKFIQSLPASYDTRIGRRGLHLRPSEIIRLSIARALVKRAKILIFDRIFDAIDDPEQLSQVMYAVEKARIRCTSIIITGKINKCVKNCNEIVLLADGKVVEKGSHDQLLQEKGLYKQMFVNQMLREHLNCGFFSNIRPNSSDDNNCDRKSSESSDADENAQAVDSMCTQTVDAVISDVIQHPQQLNSSCDESRKEVTIYVSDEDNVTHEVTESSASPIADESDELKLRSASVLSAASTVASDCTSDAGERQFYREQKTRSMIKGKYSHEYSLAHFIQYFDMNDWILLSVGSLASVTFGLGLPMYALIAGELLSILEYKTADSILQEAKYISLQFILLSLIISLSSFVSHFTFGYFETCFTCKLKRKLLKRIISLNLNWSHNESPIHPPLMKSLFTEDMKGIAKLMTSLISSYSTLTGTLILCIGYSFYTHWQLACIAVSLMPLIIFRYSWMGRSSELQMKSHAHDKKVSVYRIVQTVRGKYKLDTNKQEAEILGKLDLTQLINKINEKYESIINNQSLTQQSDVHIRSQVIAAIQCIPILAYGIVYLFATYFIQSNSIHYTELFKIIEAVIFGSILVSEGCFFTYEMQSVKHCAQLMCHLLNSFSTYKASHELSSDNCDETTDQPDDSVSPFTQTSGVSLKLQNVSFRLHHYPYKSILSNFTYSFEENSFTAIYCISSDSVPVSPSSGSIVFSLAQKLIYPTSGVVLMDHRNIASINSEHIRKATALITSNSLFLPNCSVSENIALGDIKRFVSLEEIVDVSRAIGLHRTIQSLPNGYNSKLQSIQHQLSPLDRVLVMLARAIVQNASIILLEHIDHGICQRVYMSHIDPVIQRLRNLGKTIITIPSNLTFNAHAYDTIVLLDEDGCILETGSHEHLITQNSFYTRLHQLHSKD